MRNEVITQLRSATEPLLYVYAFWLEGADAYERADAYSDLDLWFDVDGEHLDEVMELCCHTLTELAALDIDFEEPHPSPDIRQRMLHLRGSSPYLILDLCLQRHGRSVALNPDADAAKVIFDKTGVVRFEASPVCDLSAEVAALEKRFMLKKRWVDKELERANLIEALSAYHSFTLAPLVKLLRFKYCPAKADFGTKHLSYDLPAGVVARLEPLFSVTSLPDLGSKQAEAESWFKVLTTEIS